MNTKPHVMLLAMVVLCMAAVAWAADAPKSAPAPSKHAAHVAPAAHCNGAAVADEAGEDDDADLNAPGPGGGACGERRVIVRRFMRGGEGGEGCGQVCGGKGHGKGRGMGAGKGCGMGGGMGAGKGCGMGGGMGCDMGGDMGPGPGMFAHMTQALDLTAAQREKLADIHERQSRRDIQARADLEIARLDLHKAMTAEKPEAGAVNAQIDRVAKLRSDMAKAHVAALLEARALLTPEQQTKMREQHMQGPGAGMPGKGPGCGMGPGGMGMNGMGHGGPPMHVRVERDTLIRR